MTEVMVDEAQKMLVKVNDIDDLRMLQAVILPAKLKISLEQTSELLGVSISSIDRLRSRYHKVYKKEVVLKNHGGRRRENLTTTEEQEFLKQFEEKSEKGSIVIVEAIHAEYEKVVCKKVPESTIYRLLHRHRWRKIVPDKQHPKKIKLRNLSGKKNFNFK